MGSEDELKGGRLAPRRVDIRHADTCDSVERESRDNERRSPDSDTFLS